MLNQEAEGHGSRGGEVDGRGGEGTGIMLYR